MSNEDSTAKCPKCGNNVSIEIGHENPKTFEVTRISLHCSQCGWKETWKKRDLVFNKQPEPPKTMKKTFIIEYIKDTIFGEKYMRDSLNYRIMGDPFINVYEIHIPPKLPEIPKLQDGGIITDPKIALIDHGCGLKVPEPTKNGDCRDYLTKESPEIPMDINQWKRIYGKPEIVKSCDNCGWVVNEKEGYQYCKNWKPCHNKGLWKPQEPKNGDKKYSKKSIYASEPKVDFDIFKKKENK